MSIEGVKCNGVVKQEVLSSSDGLLTYRRRKRTATGGESNCPQGDAAVSVDEEDQQSRDSYPGSSSSSTPAGPSLSPSGSRHPPTISTRLDILERAVGDVRSAQSTIIATLTELLAQQRHFAAAARYTFDMIYEIVRHHSLEMPPTSVFSHPLSTIGPPFPDWVPPPQPEHTLSPQDDQALSEDQDQDPAGTDDADDGTQTQMEVESTTADASVAATLDPPASDLPASDAPGSGAE